MSPSELQFSTRQERVPAVDKVQGVLPEQKNWFEEGMIGVPDDQMSGQCKSSWAISSVGTLEALAAIKGV